MSKSIKFILPLFIFLFTLGVLWRGLSLHPEEVPSPLINQPVPHFVLPLLSHSNNSNSSNKTLTEKNFIGHITLLNIWATWCSACQQEHALLVQLAREKKIVFYGLNYKDTINDIRAFLKENGNPYQLIALDETGQAAIDWGVYGTPELFIIDAKGMIRYKKIGMLTAESWEAEIAPLLQELMQQAQEQVLQEQEQVQVQ